MNYRTYCIDVYDWEKELRSLKAQVEELRTLAANITMPLDPNKTYTIGGSKDRIGKIMDKVMDLERRIEEESHIYESNHAIMVIGATKVHGKQKQIIKERYIQHELAVNVAGHVGLSSRGERKAHESAITTISENFFRKISKKSLTKCRMKCYL